MVAGAFHDNAIVPYAGVSGADLRDTRGMWQEFAELLPRIWTQEEISYDGLTIEV